MSFSALKNRRDAKPFFVKTEVNQSGGPSHPTQSNVHDDPSIPTVPGEAIVERPIDDTLSKPKTVSKADEYSRRAKPIQHSHGMFSELASNFEIRMSPHAGRSIWLKQGSFKVPAGTIIFLDSLYHLLNFVLRLAIDIHIASRYRHHYILSIKLLHGLPEIRNTNSRTT